MPSRRIKTPPKRLHFKPRSGPWRVSHENWCINSIYQRVYRELDALPPDERTNMEAVAYTAAAAAWHATKIQPKRSGIGKTHKAYTNAQLLSMAVDVDTCEPMPCLTMAEFLDVVLNEEEKMVKTRYIAVFGKVVRLYKEANHQRFPEEFPYYKKNMYFDHEGRTKWVLVFIDTEWLMLQDVHDALQEKLASFVCDYRLAKTTPGEPLADVEMD